MSRKLPSGITRTFLEQTSIPNHGGRYTPISHKSIIEASLNEILKRNMIIEKDLYSSTHNGDIANGKIIMGNNADPNLKMMFVWGNSYNKATRFTCGVGAYIEQTDSYMFAGSLSTFSRKHTGTADQEALEMIQEQLEQADYYYKYLCSTRDKMMNINLTVRQMAEILGVLFVEKGYLNKEQMSVARDAVKNKTCFFEGLEYTNMWNFYNIVASSLKNCHPRDWFEDQLGTMNYFINYIGQDEPVSSTPVVNETVIQDPNQLNLFEEISDAEQEMISEEVNSEEFVDEVFENTDNSEGDFLSLDL